jgi:hypothetical protein
VSSNGKAWRDISDRQFRAECARLLTYIKRRKLGPRDASAIMIAVTAAIIAATFGTDRKARAKCAKLTGQALVNYERTFPARPPQ